VGEKLECSFPHEGVFKVFTEVFLEPCVSLMVVFGLDLVSRCDGFELLLVSVTCFHSFLELRDDVHFLDILGHLRDAVGHESLGFDLVVGCVDFGLDPGLLEDLLGVGGEGD
jgi:hypothetical protein